TRRRQADASHDRAAAPHDTAAAPHDTAAAPHDTAAAPHDTAAAPHDTAAAPQHEAQAQLEKLLVPVAADFLRLTRFHLDLDLLAAVLAFVEQLDGVLAGLQLEVLHRRLAQ